MAYLYICSNVTVISRVKEPEPHIFERSWSRPEGTAPALIPTKLFVTGKLFWNPYTVNDMVITLSVSKKLYPHCIFINHELNDD